MARRWWGITIGPHTASGASADRGRLSAAGITIAWYGMVESLNLAAALDVLWQPRVRAPPVAAARGGAP